MNDDFAMCNGQGCPLRGKCLRYADQLRRKRRGKYAVWTEERHSGGKCDLFIPLKQKENEHRRNNTTCD